MAIKDEASLLLRDQLLFVVIQRITMINQGNWPMPVADCISEYSHQLLAECSQNLIDWHRCRHFFINSLMYAIPSFPYLFLLTRRLMSYFGLWSKNLSLSHRLVYFCDAYSLNQFSVHLCMWDHVKSRFWRHCNFCVCVCVCMPCKIFVSNARHCSNI